jgi:hypothetical protein
MARSKTDQNAETLLDELTDRSLTLKPEAIALDLSAEPAAWDAAIRVLGRDRAYERIADRICAAYLAEYGVEFPFTEACVAHEIAYHANAYLWTQGFRGYPRHVTARLFTRAALERHCRSVEIDRKDINDLRQRIIFRYRSGLRKKPDAEQ